MAKKKEEVNTNQINFNFDKFITPMAASFELTKQELRFAEEYIATRGDIVAAAKACSMTPTKCYALLKNEKVSNYINIRIKELEGKPSVKTSKDAVMTEMALLAFSDLKDYMAWGKDYIILRDSNTLPPGASKAVSEITFTENEYGTPKNRRINRQVKVRLPDKKSALDSLAKMLGMYDSAEKTVTADDVASKIREFQTQTSMKATIPQPEDYFDGNDDDGEQQIH